MKDYLPAEAQSTRALEIMEQEFDGNVPTNRVMIQNVSLQEALAFKEQLAAIEGVSDVTWLDDMVDLKAPLEMANREMVETYYKDNHALFLFSIASGEEVAITDAIYELIGEENAMAGESVDTATQQKMTGSETMFAAALLVPVIIIILIFSTTSWMEPVFFLTAIGISILINMGTNIFLGEVSFITQSVAPILQLAVSLDYAIFLLHSFSDHRKKIADPHLAMQHAIKDSFPTIAVSALTTFFGFMALSFMQFEIGSDLGINLVKGILFSFISVMVFLPALTIVFYKWIDKTQHKPLMPSFKGIGGVVVKLRVPFLIVVFLLVVPTFLAQSQTNFIYGIGEQQETTRAGSDIKKIEEHFGESTPMVLMVPRGDVAKESELVTELEQFDHISSVMAYVNTVSPAIPAEYLDTSITEQFYSENYSRIILQTTTPNEGDQAFQLIEQVQSTAQQYYDEEIFLVGESVSLYDIKHTVEQDNRWVNLLTISTIALVLALAFKSILFPIILLLSIQSAVWINLSVPYFTESSLVYVGYLLISIIQLAATIDYAILLTDTYKDYRKEMSAVEAIKRTLDEKIFAIFISASILSSVGFILWITSSNPIVSSVGLLLGRGALLAFIMVIFFLPALLIVFDKWIRNTTWKANFLKEK